MLSPVRPYVRLSVTRVDQSKTVETRITKFSPDSSPIPLVFREQVSSGNSVDSPRAGALNEGGVGKIGDFLTLSCHISEIVQDRTKVAIDSLIGMRTRSFHWCQNQWPSVTPEPGFKVTVGKIGDFQPLSRQYLKISRVLKMGVFDVSCLFS